MPSTPKARKVTYANVASTLALALALSTGGAYAAGKVGPNQIKNNAVQSKHIKKQNVKTSDIKKNAIKTNRIKDNAVKGEKVADGSLTDADLSTDTNGMGVAGAAFDDLTIVQQYNRLGGPISVTSDATGYYQVDIPGANFVNWQDMIVLIQSDPYTHCFPNNGSGTELEIRCWDFDTQAADANELKFVLFTDASVSPRVAARGSATD